MGDGEVVLSNGAPDTETGFHSRRDQKRTAEAGNGERDAYRRVLREYRGGAYVGE